MTFFATSPSANASAAVVGTAGAAGAATAATPSGFAAGALASTTGAAAGFAFDSSDFFGASLAIVLLQIDNAIKPWRSSIPCCEQRRPSCAGPCVYGHLSMCVDRGPAGPSYAVCRDNN